jgi:hypothetical protein
MKRKSKKHDMTEKQSGTLYKVAVVQNELWIFPADSRLSQVGEALLRQAESTEGSRILEFSSWEDMERAITMSEDLAPLQGGLRVMGACALLKMEGPKTVPPPDVLDRAFTHMSPVEARTILNVKCGQDSPEGEILEADAKELREVALAEEAGKRRKVHQCGSLSETDQMVLGFLDLGGTREGLAAVIARLLANR